MAAETGSAAVRIAAAAMNIRNGRQREIMPVPFVGNTGSGDVLTLLHYDTSGAPEVHPIRLLEYGIAETKPDAGLLV